MESSRVVGRGKFRAVLQGTGEERLLTLHNVRSSEDCTVIRMFRGRMIQVVIRRFVQVFGKIGLVNGLTSR